MSPFSAVGTLLPSTPSTLRTARGMRQGRIPPPQPQGWFANLLARRTPQRGSATAATRCNPYYDKALGDQRCSSPYIATVHWRANYPPAMTVTHP
jgi:hypothetical protein